MINVLLTSKPWHAEMADNLREATCDDWVHIGNKEEFTLEHLDKINPAYVFVPHWSHLISAEIYEKYPCVIFHMTDLPYGRGGSPLQNLIALGHTHTKISAIQCSNGIDNGAVYLKRPLTLKGTARQIFERAAIVVESMIYAITTADLVPVPQEGTPTIFRRRQKENSNISSVENLDEMYDLVRMLDCEGYPPAFLNTDRFCFTFSKAAKEQDTITAQVVITKRAFEEKPCT